MEPKSHLTAEYAQQNILKSQLEQSLSRFKKSIKEMIAQNPDRFKDLTNPFVIAELGCADCCNSLEIYTLLISSVRELSDVPIHLYLNDLPQSNLMQGFQNAQQATKSFKNVYIYAIPGSFYNRLFSDKQVDYFISNHAMYYLSKHPGVPSGDRLFFTFQDTESENGKIWDKQTQEEWLLFLSLRHAELKTNGRLHVFNNIYNPKFEDELLRIPKALIRGALKKRNLSDKEVGFTLLQTKRIVSQYLEPFEQNKTTLKSVWNDQFEVPCHTYVLYKQDGDAMQLGINHTNYMKSWSYAMLQHEALRHGLDPDVVKSILDEVYSDLPKELSKIAATFKEYDIMLFMTIQKDEQD